ncbi:hypothetical protein [Streptomyces sp. H27-C3]|nr:hypothetical protein [Streptomyces sp. H27-C3]MDJ0466957.1 hypothetical protein [Streptomyces sp. H27-C3]
MNQAAVGEIVALAAELKLDVVRLVEICCVRLSEGYGTRAAGR